MSLIGCPLWPLRAARTPQPHTLHRTDPLHAVTEQPPDRPNLRFWDLIDLILLEALLDDDLTPLRDAAIAIFETRGTHAWPPDLAIPEAWRAPYAAGVAELDAGLPAQVDD